MEAIVLAGGFGTRLQKIITDVPKPMADINGKPFLFFVLNYLQKQMIRKVVLSVGYKNEIIINYFGKKFGNITIEYAIEDQPLGTGGAIKRSLQQTDSDHILVFNGDTFFNINPGEFMSFHVSNKAQVSLALKPMEDVGRYGMVLTDDDNRVLSFKEKEHSGKGNINGGVYVINRDVFDSFPMTDKFSFEKDFMGDNLARLMVYGFFSDSYFIDIGLPEDYQKAQHELKDII